MYFTTASWGPLKKKKKIRGPWARAQCAHWLRRLCGQHNCHYYYERILLQCRGVKKNLQEHLTTEKNKTNDTVSQDENMSQDCQRSNGRLKSSVLSGRLKVISDGDVMIMQGSDIGSRTIVPWLEQSLTPHSTQYRSFRRRSSHPITGLILTNKTVQENTDKQTQYKSEKVDKLKYSKTKLPWFSCLLQHSARKRGGLILQRPGAHTIVLLYNMVLPVNLLSYHDLHLIVCLITSYSI